jgi:hypothetical protein
LARRLIIVTALLLASAAPGQAELVQLKHGSGTRSPGSAAARSSSGAADLARRRGGCRAAATRRRRAVAEPERLLPKDRARAPATDPLVPTEWWRPRSARHVRLAGARQADHRRRLRPRHHAPRVRDRPNTILMNKQTTTDDEEDHGTEVAP